MAPTSTQAVRAHSTPNQAREALRSALEGSRGGDNRRRILRTLDTHPLNPNRLASVLGLDYKTIRHHLSVLEDAGMVTSAGDQYGAVYVLTGQVRQHWDLVDDGTT